MESSQDPLDFSDDEELLNSFAAGARHGGGASAPHGEAQDSAAPQPDELPDTATATATATATTTTTTTTTTTPTTYPQQLMVRLLASLAFKEKDTKISAEALAAVTEYLRIFTREAIWRAEDERRVEMRQGPANQPDDENQMLRVSHLTKITSNLILDF